MIDLYIIKDIVSWALMIAGGVAVVSGAIGLVRFPDFFSRIHAAGVTDTGGAELIIIGMLLQAPDWIVAAKLIFIGVFLFLTSPVATHAVAHPGPGPSRHRRHPSVSATPWWTTRR